MRSPLDPCDKCFAIGNPSIRRVPGEGPKDAEVMFVGEGPGKFENNTLRPFVGSTGRELDSTYMPLAGLSRAECFVTNAFRCKFADSGDAPKQDVVDSCADKHLRKEIGIVKPKFIVLMGGISNSLLRLPQGVETIHGTGREACLYGHNFRAFSTFHPALGMHQTSAMTALLNDFRRLRLFIAGDLDVVSDEFPSPGYYRISDPEVLDQVLEGQWDLTHLAIDTESRKTWKGFRPTIKYIPWSIQFAIGPTDGYFIKITDEDVAHRFGKHAKRFRKVVFHNAQHDMGILHECGIDLDWKRVEDTMMLAYHDARLPKGLKALSYQLAGIQMRNFDDVVTPYGRRAAMEYFERASFMEWKTPEQEPTGEMETKKCPDCKGTTVLSVGRGKLKKVYECGCDSGYVTVSKMTRKQGMGAKISRLITDYLKNPEAMDCQARWENWGSGVLELIEKLGPLPLPSVEMVPESEIMIYSCSDSVSTWRIYNILKTRLRDLRRSFNGKL